MAFPSMLTQGRAVASTRLGGRLGLEMEPHVAGIRRGNHPYVCLRHEPLVPFGVGSHDPPGGCRDAVGILEHPKLLSWCEAELCNRLRPKPA